VARVIGRRVYDKQAHELQPGEYTLHSLDGEPTWWCGRASRRPADDRQALSGHQVAEHDDGTITVSPSILTGRGERQWHGYLEHGVWREV
jgi:hypothetical protein